MQLAVFPDRNWLGFQVENDVDFLYFTTTLTTFCKENATEIWSQLN